MDDQNATSILEQIAEGSLGKVIERNNKMILIESNTEKVKNSVLREFVQQSIIDGHEFDAITEFLLNIDEAVEQNQVRKTLKDYLS